MQLILIHLNDFMGRCGYHFAMSAGFRKRLNKLFSTYLFG